MAAIRCCKMERCTVVGSTSIDVGASINESLDVVQCALPGCAKEIPVELSL